MYLHGGEPARPSDAPLAAQQQGLESARRQEPLAARYSAAQVEAQQPELLAALPQA
jgi:hypothetical protein